MALRVCCVPVPLWEVNAAMMAYAETIPDTFGYFEDDIVSRDIVGETQGSIFDATQTMCLRTTSTSARRR